MEHELKRIADALERQVNPKWLKKDQEETRARFDRKELYQSGVTKKIRRRLSKRPAEYPAYTKKRLKMDEPKNDQVPTIQYEQTRAG